MRGKERCYQVVVDGVREARASARRRISEKLAAIAKDYVDWADANARFELYDWAPSADGSAHQLVKLRVNADILSDEVVDCAVRLSALELRLRVTRI